MENVRFNHEKSMEEIVEQVTLHAIQHGPLTFGFVILDTPLPVIPGLKAVYDRAAGNRDFGTIKVRTLESEKRPNEQVIAIIPEVRSISRKQFEALVMSLFPGFEVRTEWHTRIGDIRTIAGLVAMQLILDES